MASQTRRRNLPTFFDWIEDFQFGPRFGLGEHAIRVEEYQEDGTYTVKAELPGIDPERDVDISVEHGLLTLRAQRTEESKEGKRSEFLYGTFTRRIQLPEGVDEDDITASYDNGVLTIKAPAGRVATAPRRIRVSRPGTEGLAGVSTPEPTTGIPGVSDPQQTPGQERDVMDTREQDRQRDVMGTGDIGDTGDSGSTGDFRDVES
jgi:HSP20 family protein